VTLKYDPFGRRIQKVFTQNSTTTTTNYLYDGSNAVEDLDQSGSLIARYAQTQNIDEPLAEQRSGTTSYYEADGLGSVTSLTSSAGAIANTYTYDSFGKLTASTGSISNRFQYTAREFDSETGLYFYRARYYDPTAGRFLSEDPLGFLGGIDLYAYVGNNATNFLDSLGLQGGPWHPPAGIHTKCTEDDSCPVIKGKIWVLQRMIDSHTGWDRIMPRPRGGNKHSQEIADLWKQLAECQALEPIKCKACDKPDRRPVPIPLIGPILDAITDPIIDVLQGALNDIKNWNPPPRRPIWGPVPVPGPLPVPVIP
jgi:RHS repeat-associated protein